MADGLSDLVEVARLQEMTEFVFDALRVACEIVSSTGERLASTGEVPCGKTLVVAAVRVPVEVDGKILGHILAYAPPRRRREAQVLASSLARGAKILAEVAFARRREQVAVERAVAMEATSHRLLAATRTMHWELDLATDELLLMGAQAETVLGHPASQFTNLKAWLEVVHAEDREIVRQFCRHRLLAGGEHQIEFRLVGAAGEVRWIHAQASAVHWANGPERVVGFMYDVTRRKRAETFLSEREEELRRSHELLQCVVDALPAHVYARDLDGRFLVVNESLAQDLGVSKAELIAAPFGDVRPADVEAATRSDDLRVVETGLPLEVEETVPSGAGPRTMLTMKVPMRDQEGRVYGVCGVSTDISTRKKMEESLRSSEAALRNAQRLARLGNWTWHFSGRLEWSDEMYRLFGVDGRTFATSIDEVLAVVHQDDRASVEQQVRSIMSGEQPKSFEYRAIWPDGTIHHHHCECDEFKRDDDGRPLSLTGTTQDVTEARLLEARLRQSEKMEAIGQLAGGIAHDFNNQLVVVLGYANLLSERIQDPILHRYAVSIMRAAQRSSDLTTQLLAFSRKGKCVTAPVDVHGLIDEVVRLLERTIDRRVVIRRCLDARPSVVLGDRTQLQTAILHLATNARDAMPEGGVLTLSTRVEQVGQDGTWLAGGRHLAIMVSDTGIGMDEETRRRIFEPFFTTKEKGLGTGLTLASVLGSIQSHHGTIAVESEPGRGSTFRILLPFLEPPPALVTADARPTRADRKACILLVDDDEMVREFATDLLQDLGYRVVTCEDGVEAVAAYRDTWQEVDLVLLDMVMPRMGGRDTYRALREINPEVKVLLASGYTFQDEPRHLLDEGVLGFVQKPFMPADLERAVANVLAC